MADRLDSLDYYRLLGVDRRATVDEIREAFHTFARRYHPDRHVGRSDKTQSRAHEVYRRGAEAYRALLDPTSRRAYDEGLLRGELRLSPEQNANSGRPPGFASSIRPPKMRTGRARPFLQKAEAAITAGDFKQARLHLKIALQHEPDNLYLTERLTEVEQKLQGTG